MHLSLLPDTVYCLMFLLWTMFEINHIIGYFRRKPVNVMEGFWNEISPVLQTDLLWASPSLFRVAVSISLIIPSSLLLPTYHLTLCSLVACFPCFPAILISFFLSYLPTPSHMLIFSLPELASPLAPLLAISCCSSYRVSSFFCPLTFLHFLSSLGTVCVSDCFKSDKCGPS